MNDNQKNMETPAGGDAREKVRNQLERILYDLRNGAIPEENTIQELKQVFGEYHTEQRRKRKNTVSKKTQLEKLNSRKFKFLDVVADEKDRNEQSEFVLDAESVPFLKSIALKKIILEADAEEWLDQYSFLECGFIAPFSVCLKENAVKGYCLTTKGWSWIQTEKIAEYLKAQDTSFLLTKNMCLQPTYWTDTEFIQTVMIQMYYKDEKIDSYFIFKDYEAELLVGCKIQDSYEVSYCVAAEFKADNEVKQTSRIYELAGSDKIDKLTIIVPSNEEEQRLKLHRGLTTQTLKKLNYYNITEGGK